MYVTTRKQAESQFIKEIRWKRHHYSMQTSSLTKLRWTMVGQLEYPSLPRHTYSVLRQCLLLKMWPMSERRATPAALEPEVAAGITSPSILLFQGYPVNSSFPRFRITFKVYRSRGPVLHNAHACGASDSWVIYTSGRCRCRGHCLTHFAKKVAQESCASGSLFLRSSRRQRSTALESVVVVNNACNNA